jgi:thiol-disulfide isomerase/thioredoxin
MRQNLGAPGLALALALAMPGASGAQAADNVAGKVALARLEVESAAAMPFDVVALRGRPSVLYVWGHWCRACERSTPEMIDLAQRFPGVNFVFINTDFPARALAASPTALPPNITDTRVSRASFDDQAMRKKDFRFAELGLVFGIPQYFLLDPAGRIETSGNGSRYPRHIASWLDAGSRRQ